MPSDDHCGAKCRDGGFCTQYPVNGSERCRMHGGQGQPEDNQNALGNDGGVPKGNGNRITHGVKPDPFNLYDHHKEDAQAWVDELTAGYAEHYGVPKESPLYEHLLRASIHIIVSTS